ncbi:MAG: BACON domain-containing protein [Thermoanaerobaculales bacterium]
MVWSNSVNSSVSQILARSYDSSGNPVTSAALLSDSNGLADVPDVAFNSIDGNFLVVWEQAVNGWWNVLGIGVNSTLQLLPKVTLTAGPWHERYPRVAYSSGAGNYLVVWDDGRSMKTFDIYGQLVNRSFALAGNTLAIYAGTYTEWAPAVAGLDTSSQFLVAYQTDTNGGGLFQMHACLVSGNGNVGGQFIVREWNNQRTNPAVAAQLGSSNYLVTFTDNGMTTQPDIFGQVVTSSAQLGGSLITVARGRKGQELPTVAYDSAHDEYLAVWMDYRSGSDYDIYGRRVSSSGVVQGSELAIGNQATSLLYGYPVVAYDPSADEYLVVWAEIHSQATGYDVYARRVKWDGSFPGSPFLVSRDSNAGNEGNPAVAYNPTANEYLVAWNAYDSSGHWRVWGQRVAPAGTLSGSGFVISASTADCGPPRLAYNPATNQYLVIWEDFRNGADTIYDQLVNANGTVAGGNYAVTTASGSKAGYSVVYGSAGNDFLAVWGDSRSGAAVYGQHLSSNAAWVGSDFAIAASSAPASVPTVGYDAKNHDFLVAWQQPGTTTDWDIWARRVPESGTPANPGFAVSTAVDIQDFVELAQDTANGQFLLVWQDFRAGSYDIYGQRWAQSSCSLSLSSTSQSFAAAGGAGSVSVTLVSGSNCAWTATSNAAWITVTGGASGTDNGTVSYSVAADAGAARSGTITIAGQTFTVNQAALSCSYALSAPNASVPASGGSGSFNVTAGSGCTWTATPSVGWIHVTSGSSGSGSGTVGFSVDGNAGSVRSGTITVSDETFTINQAALVCTYALSASSTSLPASGGSGSFNVTAGSGCAWTATPSVTWIHITSGSSGSGNGTVGYGVDANAGSGRSGTIAVADQTFTANQAAGGGTSGYSHWLPAVIHKDVPSKNAKWRSDIAVLNRSSLSTTVQIFFYSTYGVLTTTYPLAGNAQLFLPDVVGQLNYAGDGAALEVRSDQDIILSGRTYNQVDASHTYGQDYDGQSSDALLASGQSAWLPQLTENALYRTNIGITNTGSTNASVTVTLFDGQGNVRWTDSRSYAPGGFYQYQQPYLLVGGIDQGYAKVTVNAGSGVAAYASVIDVGTGDPTTINMKR